jgi:hypothetical protein
MSSAPPTSAALKTPEHSATFAETEATQNNKDGHPEIPEPTANRTL